MTVFPASGEAAANTTLGDFADRLRSQFEAAGLVDFYALIALATNLRSASRKLFFAILGPAFDFGLAFQCSRLRFQFFRVNHRDW